MRKSFILCLLSVFLFINSDITLAQISEQIQEPQFIENNHYESLDYMIGDFKNPIKMIFSDIDGTIIPSNPNIPRGTVPESALKAAETLREADLPLILVTGRSALEAKKIAQKMGNPESYVIGQQGAVIMDGYGSIVFQTGINKKEVDKILKDIRNFNKYYHTKVKPFIYVDEQLYAFEQFKLPYIFDQPTVIKSTNDLGKDFISSKIGLYEQKPKTLRAIQQYLQKRHPEYNIVISGHCYCDISNKESTKGNAMTQLAELFGVQPQNIAAIGDAENDISMLRILKNNDGLPIAVKNAFPSVKNAASYITKDVNDGGFATAIEAILKNNKLLLQK